MWTFHLNGIIHCVVFCIWLLSFIITFLRFIYVVADVRKILLPKNIPFYACTTFYVYVSPLVDVWVVAPFWPLGIMLLGTAMYRFLWTQIFSFFLGAYLEVCTSF